MNIAVVGAGGVGGYCGARLARLMQINPEIKLYFVARGAHLDEIRRNGLLLETRDGTEKCKPSLATDNFDELPVLDICLITVKSYELESVVGRLIPKISPETIILPLLNGADIEQRIRRNLKTGILLPACIYIIAYIERPGKIVQKGASSLIHTGYSESAAAEKKSGVENELKALFEQAGIRCKWHEDPRPEIWKKFLFIASFALVTAANDAVIGKVMESDELSGSLRLIMSEIKLIAESKGIQLPDDVCEKAYALGYKFAYDSTTSFQRDYAVIDKPDERDIFGTAVLRMAEEAGITASETERVLQIIESGKPLA